MRKLVCCAGVLVFVGVALADRVVLTDGLNATITATPISQGSVPSGRAVDYSNMDVSSGNYSVSGSDPTQYVDVDDYDGVFAPGSDVLLLTQFKFVGGVNVVGGVLFFDFYESTGTTFYDGFGVQFPQSGNFIWTINISAASTIFVPNDGQVGMAVGGAPYPAATGTWYLNALAPTIGTTLADPPGINNPTTGAPMNYKFEITPEPASLALLAAALLLRRR